MDLGQSMARKGQALAAPEYLRRDPPRLNSYMEAERLARLNRLGMHDTLHQTPQQHRKNPDYVPDRETVARFWDTPTPFAGLRPEIEAGYLEVTKTGTSDDILAYAKTNGFTIDADETRHFVADRDGGASVDWRVGYKDKPKPVSNMGDGRTGATVRGIGDGVLAGGLDEAGAVVDALGLTPDRENVWNSDHRFADIWSNNQQQNSAILGYDEMAHPGYRLGGQVAGGLVVPFGAKARTVPQLFRVGAAYGGAEGFLGTDGDLGQRSIGAAVGVPLGGAVGAVGGKALELGLRAAPRIYGAVRGNAGKVPLWDQAVSAPPRVNQRGDAGLVPPVLDDITNGQVQSPDGLAPNHLNAGVEKGGVGQSETGGFSSYGVSPTPEGFRSDARLEQVQNGGDAAALRKRDYLDMGLPRAGLMDQPLTDAQRQAMAQGIDPRDVLPIASNEVGSVEEAAAIELGRVVKATAPDERTSLSSRGVKAQTGTVIPKKGPLDLVTWLRSQGGIKDQGGELRTMGIGNDGRDMDFARGEQRFGRLVDNETGMNLDDAALRAWEAGYLPGSERPDIDAFLDAINRTHSGRERFYLPEDMAEVAKFEGMRADRIALEEMQAKGPVYADRSVPADDQPFAPPEAYEEWPAGGPDFAGNINLKNLSSPQDIARALDMTQRRVGFDAATRGRISHAETERLASDLGMTPDRLLARTRGVAFNAEEALAARQLLAKSGNELVNLAKRVRSMDEPGDDALADFRRAWVRHVAIQEQVSGMTAEAGRALQQFRQVADSRMVTRDVLSAMVQSGGGRKNIEEAAQVLLDAVEAGPGVFNTMAEKLAKPTWKDKAVELWYNYLLSGPQTHAVNMVSNTLTALAQIPEHAAAGAIGKARQLIPGADIERVTGTEVGARAFGLLQGAREGIALAAKAFRTGEPSDYLTKVEAQSQKAISGRKGELLRIPTRLLMAEDELFKGIARRMDLNGMAVRIARREGLKGEAAQARIAELSANPTDEMLQSSLDYGRYLTFQRPLPSGGLGQLATVATQRAPALKLVLPFVRTPVNLVKFAAERSPAAPLLGEWRKDFFAGGARRDLALAKAMVGTGVGALMYEMASNGLITGSAPADRSKSSVLYADGWQPYSIKVGDKWISYQRLDPFSTTFGIAADMATLGDGLTEKQRENYATLLTASIVGNLANKTWLSGLSDALAAINEPQMNADRFLKRMAGSLAVPTGVAQVARTIDPMMRETETVSDYIQSRIPGMSQALPPRRDIWGNPIEKEGGIGPDLLSPLWQSTAKDDPVNRAMLEVGAPASLPDRKVGGRDLTADEYGRYVEMAGRTAHQTLTAMVTAPGWSNLSSEDRKDAIGDVIRKARKDARESLFGKTNPPRTVPPPPSGAVLDGASGGRNVYADLQKAIPGLRFTSGYRTPEYQEQMRRRGYNPAYNSSHLDGSALDMLPPASKSMAWLKSQVRRYNPDARLLIHDGHLHATFPGYYGAPVLGGARSTGMRNPLAGMPPPPDGAVIDR